MADLIKARNVKIGRNVEISGGKIVLGDNVTISDGVEINVTEKLLIKARSFIGKHFIINGRDVEIGEEFWSGHDCEIGGGSCFEKHSLLRMGCWCHLGNYGFINTARPVTIGNEVGLGQRTALYTHGAYQSILKGFPVEFGPITIEDNCWLPGAIVLPNVTIGKNTVIGVGSVVTEDIPSGCLATGVPARVIKKNVYPKQLTEIQKKEAIASILSTFIEITNSRYPVEYSYPTLTVYDEERIKRTIFDLKKMAISGQVTKAAERLRNQLRRYGIRFKYYPENGEYKPW